MLQTFQGRSLFHVPGCFGKGKLIVVRSFHSSIPPVCSQPSHVANGDGFWVEMCLRHLDITLPQCVCCQPAGSLGWWNGGLNLTRLKESFAIQPAIWPGTANRKALHGNDNQVMISSSGMWVFSDLLRSHKKNCREGNVLSTGTMHSKGPLN